jgi:hypothetical protein
MMVNFIECLEFNMNIVIFNILNLLYFTDLNKCKIFNLNLIAE